MVDLSRRAQGVTESLTLAITAKANALRMEGVDVVSFGAGEPDFGPPEDVMRNAREALDEGFSRYTPTPGILPLRQAVGQLYGSLYGAAFSPEEVIISAGGKQALYNAFQSLLDPGDEVLVPAPYWTSYIDQITLAGGVPVVVPPRPDLGVDFEALASKISARTKLLLVNTPSNPSGHVLSSEELSQLAAIVREHDLFVISDEIYELLTYGGAKHRSLILEHDLRDRGLIVSGASKALAVTGWRIGYAVGPRDLIKAMSKIQGHQTSCANSIAQRGVLAGLGGDLRGIVAPMVAEFDKRRLYTISRLRALPDVQVVEPQGAFYAFPDVSAHYGKRIGDGPVISDSLGFAQQLLEHKQVALVPGAAFGTDDFVRLSYATSIDQLEKGLDRLAEFVDELQ